MKKNILVIGSTGFIAQSVVSLLEPKKEINFILTHRNETQSNILHLDFNNPLTIENFELKKDLYLDGIFFMQGINPKKNTKEMTYDHFLKMIEVNLIGPSLLIKKLHSQINKNALILFFSSVAAKKGSYDPSYAASKAGLTGLMNSFSNEFPTLRFNSISLGLVQGSPVEKGMTDDFREKHKNRMHGNELIKVEQIALTIEMLIANTNIANSNIPIEGGFKI